LASRDRRVVDGFAPIEESCAIRMPDLLISCNWLI